MFGVAEAQLIGNDAAFCRPLPDALEPGLGGTSFASFSPLDVTIDTTGEGLLDEFAQSANGGATFVAIATRTAAGLTDRVKRRVGCVDQGGLHMVSRGYHSGIVTTCRKDQHPDTNPEGYCCDAYWNWAVLQRVGVSPLVPQVVSCTSGSVGAVYYSR